MSAVLLVTGSRALADTERAEAWSKRVLREAIDALPSGAIVVAGDAPGPDAWAMQLAGAHPQLRFCLDGERRAHGMPAGGPWWTGTDAERRAHGRRWPLVRNAAIVQWVAPHAIVCLADVRVLALEAPWSTTRGTGHTVGLVRKAKLAVTWHLCDARKGPSVMPGGSHAEWCDCRRCVAPVPA